MKSNVKTLKYKIFLAIIVFYSISTLIFIFLTVVTKIYNNEFLIPLPIKIVLLWSEFIFFLISFLYFILLIWFRDLYRRSLLLLFILNDIIFFLYYFDFFSLLSFFLG